MAVSVGAGLNELGAIPARLSGHLERLGRDVGRDLGEVGKDEVRAELVKIFGSDLRLSGSSRSRKARRQATVRAKVSSDGSTVEIFPGGDPVYINLVRGRPGGKVYGPRRKRTRALKMPNGAFRSTSTVGALDPKPERLDPAARRIADRAADEVSKAINRAISKALF